jgi:Arc/MetJ family transcription regulator
MQVYHWCMARTNIDIDEEACAAVMRRYGCKTKREAVNLALRQVSKAMTLDEALAMRGTGWDADLDEIRDGMGAPEPW